MIKGTNLEARRSRLDNWINGDRSDVWLEIVDLSGTSLALAGLLVLDMYRELPESYRAGFRRYVEGRVR